MAVAVARMNDREKHAEGIIGFIGRNNKGAADKEAVMDACLRSLPRYMVPEDIVFVETMPLNANGKIDRKELLKQWKGKQHER
jgi:acyl-CoA synthetase (AMP-forming)/AMP-acid ligase II